MQRVSTYSPWLIPLALAAVLIASPAAAQSVDVKGERELTALGEKVDKASASAEAGRVTGKIVDQWNGTPLKFDAASPPRALTAPDVQHLRRQGLGYGEISILLALAAGQPGAATVKSVNEILAKRQAGEGWGRIAHALGYPSLGSVKQSVKATERGIDNVSASGKGEKLSPVDRAEKVNKPEKPERPGKTGH